MLLGLQFCTNATAGHMQQEVDASRIPELTQIIEHVMAEAKRAGASQCEADVGLQRGLGATVRLGEVDTVEYQRDRGLGVTVYFDKRKGSASTADLSAAAVRATVEKACAIARFTAEDDCSGLADAADLAREVPDLDLYHRWDLEPDQMVQLARECEAAGMAMDPRLTNSEGASVSNQRGVRVYGNSHGFLAGFASSSHSISCVLLAQQGDDMQRDFWYSKARDPADLEDAAAIGRRAAQNAVARLGARRLATQRAPVMFIPDVARSLFGSFIGAIRGGSQYRKTSFLLDASGQTVFPTFLQIEEKPHIAKALGSSPFDGEGVATRDRQLVVDGVLQGYVLDSYSARKLGLKTTGNSDGVHNLFIRSTQPAQARAALLRTMGTGLMVTETMGDGVNPVTGDYSQGASGFWVENGEIAYPVHEITIAGNLRDMFKGIVALGDDVDKRNALQTGSVLIDGLMIAGE
jgi:PmbA protein